MRALILVGVLGTTLPACGAGDPIPVRQPAPPKEAAPALDATRGETIRGVEPQRVETATTRSAMPEDAVTRATFTTAIEHREPVDSITSLGSDHDRVYYYNEFDGLRGLRVTHRWEYQGEVVAEVPIAINGNHWRAYSSMMLDPSQLGEWRVRVVDDAGSIVRTDSFLFGTAAPVPAATTPAPGPAPPLLDPGR